MRPDHEHKRGEAVFSPERAQKETHLRMGEPLQVAQTIILPPGVSTTVSFNLEKEMFPFNTRVQSTSEEVRGGDVRSRWAHTLLDLPDDFVYRAINAFNRQKSTDEHGPVDLTVVNRGASPVILHENDRPFLLYAIPSGAVTEGEELEAIIGAHPDLGKRIVMSYRTNEVGEQVANGAFVKAADERFWIRPSNEPIDVGHLPSFNAAREYLFNEEKYLVRTNNPKYPMPTGSAYVAEIPEITIPEDKYIVIVRNAFVRENGEFKKRGFHLRSPLIDGRSNGIGHNAEIVEGDWIWISIVQNGTELKAGS